MAMMRRMRSKETVTRIAGLRAAGLMVLEISHRISSVRTAADAKVEEKTRAEILLIVGRDAESGRK